MRTIGHRREHPITFFASAALLVEGARFNDGLHCLPTGRQTFIPKGVTRFRSHEEANRCDEERLASSMAEIALQRMPDGRI